MAHSKEYIQEWIKNRIQRSEIDKYLKDKKDFIDEDNISTTLNRQVDPDSRYIKDILEK